MAGKPIFSDEQHEILRQAARRIWRTKFEAMGQTQRHMALALGLSQQSVSGLLKGTYRPGFKVATEIATLDGRDLEDLIGEFGGAPSTAAPQLDGHAAPPHHALLGHFPGLDVCIQFHSGTKHWSPWTVAAARAGYFGSSDFPAPAWTEKLDALEKVLEKARGGK